MIYPPGAYICGICVCTAVYIIFKMVLFSCCVPFLDTIIIDYIMYQNYPIRTYQKIYSAWSDMNLNHTGHIHILVYIKSIKYYFCVKPKEWQHDLLSFHSFFRFCFIQSKDLISAWLSEKCRQEGFLYIAKEKKVHVNNVQERWKTI